LLVSREFEVTGPAPHRIARSRCAQSS
jgi:hypothetical protein